MNALCAVTLLATTWSLSFTAPSTYSNNTCACTLGNKDTTTAGAPLQTMKAFELWRHRQSPTWRDSIGTLQPGPLRVAAMVRLHGVWTAEAQWKLAATYPTTIAEAGKPCTIAVPDTFGLGWSWAVVTLNGSGVRSCVSNEVVR